MLCYGVCSIRRLCNADIAAFHTPNDAISASDLSFSQSGGKSFPIPFSATPALRCISRAHRDARSQGYAAVPTIEKSIRTIAGTNANCIIFGECGTGKEQIARQIYLNSSRAQKPCTVIEAGGAALVGQHDPATMRSEMYNRIESYFKKADGGTIILKNIPQAACQWLDAG